MTEREDQARELTRLRADVARMDAALAGVRARLGDLEARIQPASTTETAPAAPPIPPTDERAESSPYAPAPEVIAHETPPPRTPRSSPFIDSIRSFLSEGNPLNKLAALSLVIGAALVFRYAVDNGWIGPSGRVALGIAGGVGLLAASEFYARKSWTRFSAGLSAAGNGLLFVALFFGHRVYEVMPSSLAFVAYVAVTATVVAQSLRYDSQGLAIFGLLGGYLVPALASTGSGNYVFLSSYLVVLDAGVMAIAYLRGWQPLKWMAFGLTTLYLGVWVEAYTSDPHGTQWLELQWLLPFLALFFVGFAAIPTWRSLSLGEPVDRFGRIMTVANGVVHFAFAAVALADHSRVWLGLVAAVVAGLYAVVSALSVRQVERDPAGMRIFTGTAAAFLVLATPYLVTGSLVTLVWCAQTVALAWACTRRPYEFLWLHVIAMLAVIGIRLVGWDELFVPGGPYPYQPDLGAYIPLTTLASWTPLAAAATFFSVAKLADRIPRDGWAARVPVTGVLAAGLVILVAAIDAEAMFLATQTLVPFSDAALQLLVRSGLLITVSVGLWWIAMVRMGGAGIPWLGHVALFSLLLGFTGYGIGWTSDYSRMAVQLGPDLGSWWLHGATLMMAPVLVIGLAAASTTPERVWNFSGERVQAVLLVIALLVTMLLLRREVFAITHAPPLADWFSDVSRASSYRALLSIAYALLALAVYVSAIRSQAKGRLYAAYGLYAFTAMKVYFFDLEGQDGLIRAFSLLAFAAILFASSWYANRRAASDSLGLGEVATP